jgi:hypothetical protein
MMDRGSEVPVKRQAQLLGLSRSSVYYVPRALPERDLLLMRRIDELHLQWPFYGSRKLTRELRSEGHDVAGLGQRSDLSADGARFHVPGGDHGCCQPQGPGLSAVSIR